MNSLKDKVAISTDATHVILGASGNTGSDHRRFPAIGGQEGARTMEGRDAGRLPALCDAKARKHSPAT